jgi:hypothetical protein
MRKKPRQLVWQVQLLLVSEERDEPATTVPADKTRELTAALADLILGAARAPADTVAKGESDEPEDHC